MALALTPEQRTQLDALEEAEATAQNAYDAARVAQTNAQTSFAAKLAQKAALDAELDALVPIANGVGVSSALTAYNDAKTALSTFLADVS